MEPKPSQAKPSQALVALMVFFAPIIAEANPADCSIRDWHPHQVTDVRTPVYIDADTFDVLKNEVGVAGQFTDDELIGAVTQALEQWNHSASGREFYYAGFGAIPRDQNGNEDEGSTLWCGKGFVVAEDTVGASQNRTRCLDPQTNIGTGFKIRLTTRRQNSAGETYEKRWVAGDPVGFTFATTFTDSQSVKYQFKDMVAILTHEFGHSLNIGHPQNNGGIMKSTSRRDLYQNDVECAEEYYDGFLGWRLLTLRQTSFTSGVFSSAVFGSGVSSAMGVSSGGQNITPNEFRSSYFHGVGTTAYIQRYSGSYQTLGTGQFLPIAPLRVHRRELLPTYRDAVIMMPRLASSYGNLSTERWTPRVYQSASGFELGVDSNLPLTECVSPAPGLMTGCGSEKSVVTLRRPVGAYDDYTNRSVIAWTHLDRSHPSVSANHDVRISWGFYDGSYTSARRLAPSSSLGVRSDVSPGLACKAFEAGEYSDCMLAYTDLADPTNRIKFRRFYAQSNGQYYYPVIEGPDQTIDSAQWHRTASPIALFYHSQKWWVIFRLALATGAGALRVYSSPNGLTDTWTYHGSLGYSATGANAIGDWTISNRVHWAN